MTVKWASSTSPPPRSGETEDEKTKPTAHADGARHSRRGKEAQPHDAQSPEQKQERKDRVLTEGASSMVRDIGDAIVVKDQNIFFLTNPDGNVPLAGQHGLGLYYHDCRFLSGYEMELAGITPTALASTAIKGFMAVFQMTDPEIRMADGGLIRKDNLGIKWERSIVSDKSAFLDLLEFQNFGLKPIEFPISLAFQAGFEDVFAVREMLDERPGKLRPRREASMADYCSAGTGYPDDGWQWQRLVRFTLERNYWRDKF